MGRLTRLALAAIVALIGYELYGIPIPEGSSQPIRLRTMILVQKLATRIASVFEVLGVCDEVGSKRYLLGLMSKKQEEPLLKIEDAVFDGVPVRIYSPITDRRDLPGMVYYHGGGFLMGNPDSHHSVTSHFAREANIVVVSVDYRLNPEFTVRDGLNDCLRATEYFIRHAEDFSVDADRICIAGDSAGGSYAAATALYFRDNNVTPAPKLQLLIYPNLQVLDLQLPSYQQNTAGPLFDRKLLTWVRGLIFFRNQTLTEHFKRNTHVTRDVRNEMATGLLNVDLLPRELLYPPYQRPVFEEGNREIWDTIKERCLDPYHYPLMAADVSGLPQTYILTAHYDQLRDEGFLYARRLQEAGVRVTHNQCAVCFHGILTAHRLLKDAQNILDDMTFYVRDHL